MEIIDIIKYEGDNTTFIWKHPAEDFNTMSQLIVHESQEVIFFLNGQALDTFGPGRHTLETQNIPLLSQHLNLITGDKTPFHCEVYYINKTEQMAIKWGTDSRVQFVEPTYGFPLEIGASGDMSIRVENSRKLLLKLVGTENLLTQTTLTTYFRSILMTRVKTYLAQTIKDNKINIFEIDENLNIISDALKSKIKDDFIEYGVALERFFVTTIVKPDGEKNYEKFKELHFRKYADIQEAKLNQEVSVIHQQTEAQKRVIEAESIAKKRAVEGYTYQQERGFDVAEKVADNEATGQFTNMGVGLGTMAGVGASVGSMVGGAVNNTMQQATPVNNYCANCGTQLSAGAVFCEECGTPVTAQPSCTSCGYIFNKPGKFCPKCGTKRGE